MAKRKKNRWLIWSLIVIIVILIVAVIIKQKRTPKGLEVEVEKIEKRTIREIVTASGKVFPEKEVRISSDVSGEIIVLNVEEGDSVKAGQVLAKIDPEAYESAVERGRATLNNARSNYAMAQASIESNLAQIEQIKAQLSNARKIHIRNQSLHAQGVISDQDFETSQTNVDQLEANLKSAQASYRSAQKSAEAASYSAKSAEASLKELRTNLSRTTITAPTDGIVSKLNVEQGERVVGTIQMTGTEMMRIANFASMEVQVEVSENDILRVSLGDTAEIEVDAYLDEVFKGVVTEIANSAANTGTGQTVALTSDQVTNFIVKIRIIPESYEALMAEKKNMPFRPGMSASVDINTDTQRDVVCVPIQSVTTREPEGDEGTKTFAGEDFIEVVFLYEADTAKLIEVRTGVQDNQFIQILEGVEPDEEVISGPYSAISRRLEDGSQVRKKENKRKDKDSGATPEK